MSRRVLELINIWKIYGKKPNQMTVLKNVNLTVERGEIVAIMGPSGSGKTTLLSIAGTLEKPSSGQVIIGGLDVTGLTEEELTKIRCKNIGFVFQTYNLIKNFTALENVIFPMLISSQYTFNEAVERGKELLKMVKLQDHINKYPGQLSGGQQQRVAIARALANDPDIILMDEPTGNLDLKSSANVMSLVKWLNEVYEQTFLIVTHNIEVASLATRIVYICDGQLYEKPPEGVLAKHFREEVEDREFLEKLLKIEIRLLSLRARNLERRIESGKIDLKDLARETTFLRHKVEFLEKVRGR